MATRTVPSHGQGRPVPRSMCQGNGSPTECIHLMGSEPDPLAHLRDAHSLLLWHLSICSSNEFPGDTKVAGGEEGRVTLCEPLPQGILKGMGAGGLRTYQASRAPPPPPPPPAFNPQYHCWEHHRLKGGIRDRHLETGQDLLVSEKRQSQGITYRRRFTPRRRESIKSHMQENTLH